MSSANISDLENIPPSTSKKPLLSTVTQAKPKRTIPLDRTNCSSLGTEQQKKIVDYIIHYEGKQSWSNYLTECGIFGPLGSKLRKKASSRRNYLSYLRSTLTNWEFGEILKSQGLCDKDKPSSENQLLEPPHAPPSEPILPATAPSTPSKSDHQSPSAAIRRAAVDSTEHEIMAHLAVQDKGRHVIDFDHPERNEGGLWAFKHERITYMGERITFASFILPVIEPRSLNSVTVTPLDNLSGFKIRQCVVPDCMVGEQERIAYLNLKMKKQPKKLKEFDKCAKAEAQNVVATAVEAFVAFSNDMRDNSTSRFTERTYSFPDGLKARPVLFGNTATAINVQYAGHSFSVGSKGQETSWAASAEWYIAFDMQVQKITTVRKASKMDDLDDLLKGINMSGGKGTYYPTKNPDPPDLPCSFGIPKSTPQPPLKPTSRPNPTPTRNSNATPVATPVKRTPDRNPKQVHTPKPPAVASSSLRQKPSSIPDRRREPAARGFAMYSPAGVMTAFLQSSKEKGHEDDASEAEDGDASQAESENEEHDDASTAESENERHDNAWEAKSENDGSDDDVYMDVSDHGTNIHGDPVSSYDFFTPSFERNFNAQVNDSVPQKPFQVNDTVPQKPFHPDDSLSGLFKRSSDRNFETAQGNDSVPQQASQSGPFGGFFTPSTGRNFAAAKTNSPVSQVASSYGSYNFDDTPPSANFAAAKRSDSPSYSEDSDEDNHENVVFRPRSILRQTGIKPSATDESSLTSDGDRKMKASNSLEELANKAKASNIVRAIIDEAKTKRTAEKADGISKKRSFDDFSESSFQTPNDESPPSKRVLINDAEDGVDDQVGEEEDVIASIEQEAKGMAKPQQPREPEETGTLHSDHNLIDLNSHGGSEKRAAKQKSERNTSQPPSGPDGETAATSVLPGLAQQADEHQSLISEIDSTTTTATSTNRYPRRNNRRLPRT